MLEPLQGFSSSLANIQVTSLVAKLIPEIRRLAPRSGGSFSGVGARNDGGCRVVPRSFHSSDIAVMGPVAILGTLADGS